MTQGAQDPLDLLDDVVDAMDAVTDMFAMNLDSRPKDLTLTEMIEIYRHNHPDKNPIIPTHAPGAAQ